MRTVTNVNSHNSLSNFADVTSDETYGCNLLCHCRSLQVIKEITARSCVPQLLTAASYKPVRCCSEGGLRTVQEHVANGIIVTAHQACTMSCLAADS